MNAKQSKRLRQKLRLAGHDPADKALQHGLYRDGTTSDRLVRSPDSGRSVYQMMKKLEAK